MDFLVPQLSATMETATVLRWLKKAGDRVKMGEPIVELETDKAAIEVEAPVDATLDAIVAPEGAKLPPGGMLARLGVAAGAQPAAPKATAEQAKPAAPTPSRPAVVASPAPVPVAAPRASAAASVPRIPGTPARVMASPLARRLAAEQGVQIAVLVGSGPHGRVRKRDVLAAAARGQGAAAPTPMARQTYAAVAGEAIEPLAPMRRRVAETVSVSRRTIPAFTLDRWVATTALHEARLALAAAVERGSGVKPTVTDFLLQAMADTLGQQPNMLDRWIDGDGGPRRVRSASIDIGLVVALTDGMMIPVLRDLGGKSLAEIARLRRDAVQRVRSGRLIASDSAPAAIALSNLGTGGADRFDAIINPGQSSILAVGREHERVVPKGGWPTVVKGFHITLSVDHRLIDGVRGAQFIGALAERIEFGPWTAG